MTIIVLGFGGQIGNSLFDAFKNSNYEVMYFKKSELDITHFTKVEELISKIKPEFVINASAYTHVDQAEIEKDQAEEINYTAVKNLANACYKMNVTLIHLSTDYVFDGSLNSPYSEQCKTNPISYYGFSKLQGELAIKSSNCKYFIIRTSWVFSHYGNNFLKTMLQLSKKESEIRVVCDQYGCPTYALDIAKAIVSILPKLRQTSDSAIYHYAGTPSVNWLVFAKNIFERAHKLNKLDFMPSLVGIETKDYPTLAVRPMNSILNSGKFEKDFDISPSDWKKGVDAVITCLD